MAGFVVIERFVFLFSFLLAEKTQVVFSPLFLAAGRYYRLLRARIETPSLFRHDFLHLAQTDIVVTLRLFCIKFCEPINRLSPLRGTGCAKWFALNFISSLWRK